MGQVPECGISEAVGTSGVERTHNGSPLTEMTPPASTSALTSASHLKGFPVALSLKYTLLPLLFIKDEK